MNNLDTQQQQQPMYVYHQPTLPQQQAAHRTQPPSPATQPPLTASNGQLCNYASLSRIHGSHSRGNLMLVSYDSSGNLYQVEGSVGMLRTSASNPQITQLNHHYQQQQSRVGQPPHLIQPSQTAIQQHQQLKQASKSQVYSLSLKILFSISYGAYCLTFFPTSFAKLGNSLSSRISP